MRVWGERAWRPLATHRPPPSSSLGAGSVGCAYRPCWLETGDSHQPLHLSSPCPPFPGMTEMPGRPQRGGGQSLHSPQPLEHSQPPFSIWGGVDTRRGPLYPKEFLETKGQGKLCLSSVSCGLLRSVLGG